MLTDTEVKRLKEIESQESEMSKQLSSLRGKLQYGKSAKKDPEQIALREQEQNIIKQKDALIEEIRSLRKKRDGNWKPDERNDWYPEPGYGPSW